MCSALLSLGAPGPGQVKMTWGKKKEEWKEGRSLAYRRRVAAAASAGTTSSLRAGGGDFQGESFSGFKVDDGDGWHMDGLN